jgi:hypothetical protein
VDIVLPNHFGEKIPVVETANHHIEDRLKMTETFDSMIDVNLDDAGEFGTLPNYTEHMLEITRASQDPSRSREGVFNLHLWLDCGDPTIDDIQVWIPIPTMKWREEDPKTYRKAVNRFKTLVECFSFTQPIEPSRLIGLKGMCLVSEEEDNRNPGKFQNGVISFQSGGGA